MVLKSEGDMPPHIHRWQPQSWELIELNDIDILLELNFVFVSHNLWTRNFNVTCSVCDLHVLLDKSTNGCHAQVANKLLSLFVQLSLHQPAHPPANKGDVSSLEEGLIWRHSARIISEGLFTQFFLGVWPVSDVLKLCLEGLLTLHLSCIF